MAETGDPAPTVPGNQSQGKKEDQSATALPNAAEGQSIIQPAGTKPTDPGLGKNSAANQQQDRYAQNKMFRWPTLAEALMIILTGGICLVTWQQNGIISRQNNLVDRQLKNADELTHKQLRAYLFVDDVYLEKTNDRTFTAVVRVTNAGATAAAHLRFLPDNGFKMFNPAMQQFKLLKLPDELKPDLMDAKFIAPGKTIELKRPVLHDPDFSPEALQRHLTRDELYWCSGIIGYTDVFGDDWTSSYLCCRTFDVEDAAEHQLKLDSWPTDSLPETH